MERNQQQQQRNKNKRISATTCPNKFLSQRSWMKSLPFTRCQSLHTHWMTLTQIPRCSGWSPGSSTRLDLLAVFIPRSHSAAVFYPVALASSLSPPLAICWWDSSVIRAETHTPVHGRFIDKKLQWTVYFLRSRVIWFVWFIPKKFLKLFFY